MPIDPLALDALARGYVAGMTSIRGRRVHRLLLREFGAFDHVLPARTEAGEPALLALAPGRLAVCCTDGRGPAADIVRCALAHVVVTTSHDLLKDTLPVVAWTIRHAGGTLTAAAADVPASAIERIATVLHGP